MSSRRLKVVSFCLASLLVGSVVSSPVNAQQVLGAIAGTVKDASGASVLSVITVYTGATDSFQSAAHRDTAEPVNGQIYSYGYNYNANEPLNTFTGGNTDIRVPYIGSPRFMQLNFASDFLVA